VNGTATVVGGGTATTTGPPSRTTSDGGSSDPGWKTAGFPTRGAKSRTVAHTELSYLSDLRSASVDVRIDGDDIAVPRPRYTAALNTGR
jgi:hypothetical protein